MLLRFRILILLLIMSLLQFTTAASSSSSLSSPSRSLSFSFDSFSSSVGTKGLNFTGNAALSATSIELTPFNPNNLRSDAIMTGRVTSSELLHLWDKASGKVADFDTNFTFVISAPDAQTHTCCCGLAFFLAPKEFLPLTQTEYDGSGLGLVGDIDQFSHSKKHPFLAVEFDTFQDTLFPDAPFHHVGIDISSMRSVNSTSSIDTLADGRETSVWITYNSTTKCLGVKFSRLRPNGSVLWSQQVGHMIDLTDLLPEFVQVGFSASTGTIYNTQNLNSWSFSSRFEVGDDLYESATSPTLAPPAIPVSNDDDYIETAGKNKHLLLEHFIPRFQFGDNHYNSATPPALAPTPDSEGDGSDDDDGGNKSTSKNRMFELEIGLSVGFTCALVICGIIRRIWLKFLHFNSRQSNPVENIDEDPATSHLSEEFGKSAGPKKFSYDVLARATNNFGEEEKLGEGGFGGVYKGFLSELNLNVAVKKTSSKSKQRIKEYASEVNIISRVRHKNLVQLIGWCHERGELLLVYELMENGSLDHHLFQSQNVLLWPLRYKIVRGLASALLYLHEEGEQAVLHRDIKSNNVMLDSQFNAKLGDFGLAKLVDHAKGSATTMVAGTFGYIAPECLNTTRARTESDVYSFGVVCLEIACGRKSIDPTAEDCRIRLLNWVWDLYGKGKVIQALDPRLATGTGTWTSCSSDSFYDREQVERVMILGLWCAHPDYLLRPSMRQAISVLNFESPLPNLPPKIPVAIYTSVSSVFNRASDDSDATASSSAYASNASGGFPGSLGSSETGYSWSTSVFASRTR